MKTTLNKEELIRMLRLMYRIRFFEERVKTLYDYHSYQRKGDIAADEYDFQTTGVIAGAAHLAIGQEATEVGTCAAFSADVKREGSDITVVAISFAVHKALEAAQELDSGTLKSDKEDSAS